MDKKQAAEPTMTPMQAMDLISSNIARLTGTRNDHAILLRAESVVREALVKSGNALSVAPTSDEKDTTPVGNA